MNINSVVIIEHLRYSRVATFIQGLYQLYKNQFFTYLEVNPLVITDDKIYILDLAAKVSKFILRSLRSN